MNSSSPRLVHLSLAPPALSTISCSSLAYLLLFTHLAHLLLILQPCPPSLSMQPSLTPSALFNLSCSSSHVNFFLSTPALSTFPCASCPIHLLFLLQACPFFLTYSNLFNLYCLYSLVHLLLGLQHFYCLFAFLVLSNVLLFLQPC